MLLKRMTALVVGTLRMGRRKRLALLGHLAIVLALNGSAQAQVYKWTDAEGRVHYGNQSPPVGTESAQTLDIPSRPAPPGKIDNVGDLTRATRRLRELRALNRGVSVSELDRPTNHRNRAKSREPVYIGYEDQTKIDNLNADIRRLSASSVETPANRSRSLRAAKAELRQIYRKYGMHSP
ncbi:MAG: DUF4124 domain-containing protein [Candidatus Competibacter denitrificans]